MNQRQGLVTGRSNESSMPISNNMNEWIRTRD